MFSNIWVVWQRPSTRLVLMLVLLLLGTVLSMRLFERLLLNQVQAVTEAANVAFTRLFVNEAWSEVGPKLDLETKAHPRDNPALRDLDMRVRQFAKGTDLVKVKIYNPKGVTVYSSDPAQLGEDKKGNKGFEAALMGRVASEINHRGKFGAFDGEVYDRNLVSSYVPVRGLQGVEAVAEIYADRTQSIEGVSAQVRTAWAYFGPGMAATFLLVWLLAQGSRPGRALPEPGPGDDSSVAAMLRSQLDVAKAQLVEAATAVAPARQSLDPLLREFGGGAIDTVERLILAYHPGEATAAARGGLPVPLGQALDSVMTAFREQAHPLGIQFTGHVVPALAQHNASRSTAIGKLVALLLDDAAMRCGNGGQLRLNVGQTGSKDIHIEVVGTRADDGFAAGRPASLALGAAESLANALGGRIEQSSNSARGPWISATIPLGG